MNLPRQTEECQNGSLVATVALSDSGSLDRFAVNLTSYLPSQLPGNRRSWSPNIDKNEHEECPSRMYIKKSHQEFISTVVNRFGVPSVYCSAFE